MLDFYIRAARAYMSRGMTLDEAINRIPAKWREGVKAALEGEVNG